MYTTSKTPNKQVQIKSKLLYDDVGEPTHHVSQNILLSSLCKDMEGLSRMTVVGYAAMASKV
jgi:hypothetical protein